MRQLTPAKNAPSTILQCVSSVVTRQRAFCVIALLLCMAIPTLSYAALPTCWFTNDAYGDQAINAPPVQVVTFNAVTLSPTGIPGAGTQAPGNPYGATASSGTIYIACSSNTQEGLVPLYGTYSTTNQEIYAPSPGIAYQIQRAGNPLLLYPNYTVPGNGGYAPTAFSNNTTFSIFYTGSLPSNGTQIPAGTLLGTWNIASICIANPVVNTNNNLTSCGTAASNYTFMQFVSGGVTLNTKTCSISSGDLTVTLPTVTVAQLGAVGATTGTTPIPSITFGQCQTNNLNVSVYISVPAPSIYGSASQGVIISGGSASGVGVQVLQSDGATPLTLNSPVTTNIKTKKNTTYNINLFARYYHISNPVSPGSVYATATYNLSYQ